MYGSSFAMVTLYPADFISLQIDPAVIPFPSPDITQPVTKISFILANSE